MKLNAKLGGITCRAIGPNSRSPTRLFKVPTIVIGADASYLAPRIPDSSTCAITTSIDPLATRYAATCNINRS